MIFFGCGTDYNLCHSAAFYSRALAGDKNFLALPSSELLLSTETYINRNKRYIVAGFSRSGETTESIDVLKKLMDMQNISTFIFSARKNSTITGIAKHSYVCDKLQEKSIAMTKAYTGFLFAYCLALAKHLERKDIIGDFKKLVDYFSANTERMFSEVENLHWLPEFSRYFVLGSGFNYGIAVEADLKMKEMAATDAYSYHLHEFIHGPKTLVNSGSLCLMLVSDYLSSSITEIIEELLDLGSKILAVGYENILKIKNPNYYNIKIETDFKTGFAKPFINIPVFQMLAYARAVKKGLNPDSPKNLNFTTKLKI